MVLASSILYTLFRDWLFTRMVSDILIGDGLEQQSAYVYPMLLKAMLFKY
jgi:hypothetical protein